MKILEMARVDEARMKVEAVGALLFALSEEYLEDIPNLIYEAQHRRNVLEAKYMAISALLDEAKKELCELAQS